MPEKNHNIPVTGHNVEQGFTCVILCAGTSSRFGRDKIMASLIGRPVLSYVIDALQAMGGDLALNVSAQQIQDNPQYEKYDLPLIPDAKIKTPHKASDKDGKLGPLAGIYSALKWGADNGRKTVLIWPGDTPFAPLNWAQKMQDFAVKARRNPSIVIAQSTTGKHYVCGLWPTSLADDLQQAITDGHRSIRRYLEQCQDAGMEVHYLNFDVDFSVADQEGNLRSIDGFFNINTADDLEQAECMMKEWLRRENAM